MTQNGAPSTLSLFTSILNKAEADYTAATTSSNSDNHNAAAPATAAVTTARAKLFHIATQLVRLNLSHDDSSSNSANTIKLWCIILRFLHKYPDYALYRIVGSEKKNNNKKTRQNDKQDEVGDSLQDGEDTENEEVAYWLLPRLLRCMITAQTSSPSTKSTRRSPSSRSAEVEARDNEQQQQEKVRDDEDDLVQQGQQWISDLVTNCSRSWYRRGEGGLGRRRELVKALIQLAQGESIAHDDCYPSHAQSLT